MHGVVPLGEIIPGLQTDAAVGDAVGEKVGFAVVELAVGEKVVGEKVGFAVMVLAVGEKSSSTGAVGGLVSGSTRAVGASVGFTEAVGGFVSGRKGAVGTSVGSTRVGTSEGFSVGEGSSASP